MTETLLPSGEKEISPPEASSTVRDEGSVHSLPGAFESDENRNVALSVVNGKHGKTEDEGVEEGLVASELKIVVEIKPKHEEGDMNGHSADELDAQPDRRTSSRARKPAASSTSAARAAETESSKRKELWSAPEGRGVALGDIDAIKEALSKLPGKSDTLQGLHRLLYNAPSKHMEVKAHIRAWRGVASEEGGEVEKRWKKKLEGWKLEGLKDLTGILQLPHSGTKEDLMDRLWDFLKSPKQVSARGGGGNSKKASKKKAKTSGKNGKPGSSKGRGKGKKGSDSDDDDEESKSEEEMEEEVVEEKSAKPPEGKIDNSTKRIITDKPKPATMSAGRNDNAGDDEEEGEEDEEITEDEFDEYESKARKSQKRSSTKRKAPSTSSAKSSSKRRRRGAGASDGDIDSEEQGGSSVRGKKSALSEERIVDSELILSAQFGQQLLEENARLKLDIARLCDNASKPSAGAADQTQMIDDTISAALALSASRAPGISATDTEAHIVRLEKLTGELQSNLDTTEAKLKAAEIAREKAERRRQELAEQARRDADFAARRIEQLEEECARMRTDKVDQSKKDRDEKRAESEEIVALRKRVGDLEDALVESEHGREAAEREASFRAEELDAVVAQCRELEERCTEIDSLRDGEAACFSRILDLEAAVAQERETVEQLRSTVRRLGGEDDTAAHFIASAPLSDSEEPDGPDTNGKSLFSEVEDRRKEWENKHRDLSAKHAGLVRAHTMSIHQQERMRNHISRLSQLSLAKGDQERVRRLESALAQRESENKELSAKLNALERERGLGGPGLFRMDLGGGSPGPEDASALGTMRLRLQHLTAENEALRRENRTGRMMRLGETEKLRSTEKALAERDAELESERAKLANVKFELDDLKLRLKAGIIGEHRTEPANDLSRSNTRDEAAAPAAEPQKDSRLNTSVPTPWRPRGTHTLSGVAPRQGSHGPVPPDFLPILPAQEISHANHPMFVDGTPSRVASPIPQPSSPNSPTCPIFPNTRLSTSSPTSTFPSTTSPSISDATTSSTTSDFSSLARHSSADDTPSRPTTHLHFQSTSFLPSSPCGGGMAYADSPLGSVSSIMIEEQREAPAKGNAKGMRTFLERGKGPKKVFVSADTANNEDCKTQ
ncbi:Protein Spindly [Gonapodya sp. JEL0774]|nr:Protein Spindly [Gonapodya sp. JEL0774]